MRFHVVLGLCLLAAAGCGSASTTSNTRLVPIGAGLRGPPGFRASVYARGVPRIAAFAFDSRGRLWAAAAGLTSHARDGVYLIPGQGGHPVKAIGGLRTPLGLTWDRGRLYVASLGRVDAFTGFDGRRFARRALILKGPAAGSENNGLVRAADGRLMMGVTASCDHCTPASRWSGAIVSFRPDGSDLRLFARRIRAPIGLAYYPGSSDLLVSMNQRDDLAARTPGDWLSIVREGQDWGFPDCYGQGGAVCRGVPRPTAVLDEHAAAGGVVVVGGQLGATVESSALVAEWQTGSVRRVALHRTGSTYRGTVVPFLSGARHPLALALAPGRSLLVGDWASGTVYRVRPASS